MSLTSRSFGQPEKEAHVIKLYRLFLLAFCLLAFPLVTLAEDTPKTDQDAGLAARLVGDWKGTWSVAATGDSGVTVTIKLDKKGALKGNSSWESVWGSLVEDLTEVTVKDRTFKAAGNLRGFEAVISEDGKSMEGTCHTPAGQGTIRLKTKSK